MINGLTVAGLLDTGVQLKHHCNRPWAPERLVGSGLIEITRKPNRQPAWRSCRSWSIIQHLWRAQEF
jgi:hypothetical protein